MILRVGALHKLILANIQNINQPKVKSSHLAVWVLVFQNKQGS